MPGCSRHRRGARPPRPPALDRPMLRATILTALVCLAACPGLAEEYKFGPASQRVEGVPKGTVTEGVWKSTVFPGTIRQYWVYVPKQYDGKTPAAVMVFQDGHAYV